MKIKFKHNKKCILKAMGSDFTTKDINKIINKTVEKWLGDDSLGKASHLAEMVHNNLPYEAILFIAVQGLRERIVPATKEGILSKNAKKQSDRETEPSMEGFQKFVEGLIAGLEKEEARKNEDTKPEKDASI